MSSPHENEKSAKDPLVRVSSQEIDEAIHQLQTAFGDGRLDEQEFDDRMSKAIQVKTKGELFALLDDLVSEPKSSSIRFPSFGARRLDHGALAVFSGIEKKGHFVLPKSYQVTAIMGGCLLDLRDATLESSTTDIQITAILGGVQVFVPSDVRVQVHKTSLFGGFSQRVANDHLPAAAPVIHIRGIAIFGGVEIKTKD